MIFYILTLQNTLMLVTPENRKMPPTEVWLPLIPLFGLRWHFIVVNRMADSLQAEFKMREIPVPEEKPGRDVGGVFDFGMLFNNPTFEFPHYYWFLGLFIG